MPDINYPNNKKSHKRFKKSRKLKRFRRIPLSHMIPNIITLLALTSGLTSIRMALESRFELAIGAIIIAAILDVMDGLAARMLKTTSKFGAELDSLADFVNFGVAPAIILYVWSLNSLASIGWIAVLVFAMCSALRLARFNASLEKDDIPSWQRQYFFQGIPAPAGAIAVLLPIYLYNLGLVEVRDMPELLVVFCLIMAGFSISKIPTFSIKFLGNKIKQELVFLIMIIIAVTIALLVSYPWPTLSVLTCSYLSLIPISYLRFKKLKNRFANHDGASNPNPNTKPQSTGKAQDTEESTNDIDGENIVKISKGK